ncbi:hypothetical protein EDB19DRAFT_1916967 [Suillus lakei]|nr:hypothetical protein EDB19DRAFT_1916967 [Suillus lakei]
MLNSFLRHFTTSASTARPQSSRVFSDIAINNKPSGHITFKLQEGERLFVPKRTVSCQSSSVPSGSSGTLNFRFSAYRGDKGSREGDAGGPLGVEVDELNKTMDGLKLAVQPAKEKQNATKEECSKLEKDMDEFKNNKEGKINKLKAEISKQTAAPQKQAVVPLHFLFCSLMEKDVKEAEGSIKGAHAQIAKLNKDMTTLSAKLAKHEADHARAEHKLQEERAMLPQFDNELEDLENAIREQKKGVSDALKGLEHDVEMDKVMQAKFYEFDQDIPSLQAKADELRKKQKGMKKQVNLKVMNMIDTVEKELDLKKMSATILKDNEKIEDAIEKLDRSKRNALQKEKVNGDVGGIFAELLPDNFAKLQPPEGQDSMQGLEVKVQLGTAWKQSLTELRGGQRSLIALSLITAVQAGTHVHS